VIAALKHSTVRQNQDAETRRLIRKTERRSWPKREGVWPKNAVCGQNVKNAGQKKYIMSVGLKENDDVLDYLQDVINKISEDNDFMKDFENSRGSGKIKFYKKYLQISALFKYNYVSKIKQTAWDMFLDTNDKLKEGFKDEPEPVKEIKKVDEEKLNKLAEKAKTRGTGAKYDEEKKKEEEIKRRKKWKKQEKNKRKKTERKKKIRQKRQKKEERRRNNYIKLKKV
jgi:hypothetical protein